MIAKRLACIGAVVACLSVACTLDTAGLGASLPSGEGDDASVPEDVGTGSPAVYDAPIGAVDAPSLADVATPVDATPDAPWGDGSDPCDQDGDGYRVVGGACGGTDCCDFDPKAHPGQTDYFTTADACGSFDYNCDGTDTPEYGVVDCQLSWFSCSGNGFETATACGDVGMFASCSYEWTISCSKSDASQAQACH